VCVWVCVVVKKRGQHVYSCNGSIGLASKVMKCSTALYDVRRFRCNQTRNLSYYMLIVYCYSLLWLICLLYFNCILFFLCYMQSNTLYEWYESHLHIIRVRFGGKGWFSYNVINWDWNFCWKNSSHLIPLSNRIHFQSQYMWETTMHKRNMIS